MARGDHGVFQGLDPARLGARNGVLVGKPYRYRGQPGWNPAAAITTSHAEDISRECPRCQAEAGKNCRSSSGKVFADYEPCHSERRNAS